MKSYKIQTQNEGTLMVYHPEPMYVGDMLDEYYFHTRFNTVEVAMASIVIVNISRNPHELKYVAIKNRFYGNDLVHEFITRNWVACRRERNDLIDSIKYQHHPNVIFVVDDLDEIMMLKLKHG